MNETRLVNWDSVTWEEFTWALTDYHDREYLGRSAKSGENAYLEIVAELGPVSIAERASHLGSLVLFLNRWNCHLDSKTDETRTALKHWVSEEADSLEALTGITLTSRLATGLAAECDRLHESLIALKGCASPRIPQMGIAAASKILHLMAPSLVVMWDNDIKKAGRWRRYGEFLLDMHRFALHLRDNLAPHGARHDLDAYLQQLLNYPIQKPLAKYIDEYNWRAAREIAAVGTKASGG